VRFFHLHAILTAQDKFEYFYEIKGGTMKEKSKQENVFKWVFFLLSCGALISAGIFIEKIILSEVIWLDYFSALAFGAIGIGVSAYSFFHSSSSK
jgi:hypothetical protein